MGQRGPAPEPTALRILRGNPGRRPLPKDEPKPRPVAPKCPTWLDKEARREWRRIAPELERLGLLTGVDLAVMAAYCQSWSRWQQAERIVSEKGLTCLAGTGGLKPRPEVAIAQNERRLMLAFGARLGLSPSDRGRMTLPGADDAEEEDLFDV